MGNIIEHNPKKSTIHETLWSRNQSLQSLIMHLSNLKYTDNYENDLLLLKEYISKHKYELNNKNMYDESSLMLACTFCNRTNVLIMEKVVKILIDANTDLNLQDCSGRTALILAHANLPHTKNIIKMLIQSYTDIHFRQKLDNHQLYLIKEKAKLSQKQYQQNITTFEFICRVMNEEIVKMTLNKYKYNEIELINLIMCGYHIKLLVSYLAKLYFLKLGFFRIY